MYTNNKRSLLINLILSGFFLFYLGFLMHYYIFQDTRWTRLLSVFGVCLIVLGWLKIRKTLAGVDSGFIPLFIFFVVVCMANYFIGIPSMILDNRQNELIISPQAAWMYLICLIFLIPTVKDDIKCLLRWSIVYAFTSLAFVIYNFNDFYFNAASLIQYMIGWQAYIINRPQEPVTLLIPIASFLFFFKDMPKLWKVIICISFPLAILAAVFAGRRISSSFLFVYILIAIYINLIKQKSRIPYVIILLTIFCMIFIEIGGLNRLENLLDRNFVVMANRIDDDTRSGVNEDFINDMMRDPTDWILGRGMAGTYKSMTAQMVDRLHRTVHETGFLNIILHGGLLMLAPYVLMIIYAFVKGFFYSNNYFVKSCAMFELYHLFLLYPSGHLKLTMECVILFVFMRICVTAKWRNYSDENIIKVLFPQVSRLRRRN